MCSVSSYGHLVFGNGYILGEYAMELPHDSETVNKCHLNPKERLTWTSGSVLASSFWLTNQADEEEEEGGCDGSGLRQCHKENGSEKTNK